MVNQAGGKTDFSRERESIKVLYFKILSSNLNFCCRQVGNLTLIFFLVAAHGQSVMFNGSWGTIILDFKLPIRSEVD